MKSFAVLLALFVSVAFVGCNSGDSVPGPRPFIGVLSAKKLGSGPSITSQYEIAVHYENVVPGKYEVGIGFGYIPSNANLKTLASSSAGVYALAHSEVLKNPAGDIRITLEPTAVQNLKGTMDGKIYAILSGYPHGKEWRVAAHDVYALPPE